MEKFIPKFQIELLVLYKLYEEANNAGEPLFSQIIAEKFSPPLPFKRVELALEALYEEDKVSYRSSNLEFYSINNKGLMAVEAQLRDPESFLSSYLKHGDSFLRPEFAPAADRVVTFNHNQPEVLHISEQLAEIHEVVRGANDPEIEPEEKQRVLTSLEVAQTLWDAGSLRLIQVKIGVLMAVEDAERLLSRVGKAVGAGLLIEAIKTFAKNHFQIDLDSL